MQMDEFYRLHLEEYSNLTQVQKQDYVRRLKEMEAGPIRKLGHAATADV